MLIWSPTPDALLAAVELPLLEEELGAWASRFVKRLVASVVSPDFKSLSKVVRALFERIGLAGFVGLGRTCGGRIISTDERLEMVIMGFRLFRMRWRDGARPFLPAILVSFGAWRHFCNALHTRIMIQFTPTHYRTMLPKL